MLLSRRTPWSTPLMVVVVITCLGLGWWQVSRAESGNLPSYVYSVMWPFFAGYAVYIWHAMRRPAAYPEKEPKPTVDDEALAEYNRYLSARKSVAQRRAGPSVSSRGDGRNRGTATTAG
ncbi:MAG: hypothetical protein ACRDSP_23820 [Pseudonocardiaceae bacterium]